MDTKHIKISDYNYDLPDERIAKFPIAQRDHSKLLVYKHGEVSDDVFHHLPTYLPQGALMIFNNTKVIQARLHFRKETGALIEVFLMEPAEPTDYELMFQTTGHCSWLCMIGNLKKWNGEASRHLRIHDILAPCNASVRSAVYGLCMEGLLLRQRNFLVVESLQVRHLAFQLGKVYLRINLISKEHRFLFVNTSLVGCNLDEEVSA